MGCDNAIEFEVVTPTGDIVIANDYSHSDLFWALRGGGGGTFGVVAKVTMKTHPRTTVGAIRVSIYPNAGKKAEFAKALAHLLAATPEWTDWGLSGHPIVYGHDFESLLSAPGKSVYEIQAMVGPVMSKLRGMGMTVTISSLDDAFNSMLASSGTALNAQIPSQAGFGHEGPGIMASRLISREGVKNSLKMEAAIKYFLEKGYIMEPFIVGGPGVANTKASNALNPAWRKTILHFSILPNGQSHIKTVGKVKEAYAGLRDGVQLLDEMSANSGAYMNEVSARYSGHKATDKISGNVVRARLEKGVLGIEL
jgi:hypothetical protein